jgi:hypothetical protein
MPRIEDMTNNSNDHHIRFIIQLDGSKILWQEPPIVIATIKFDGVAIEGQTDYILAKGVT